LIKAQAMIDDVPISCFFFEYKLSAFRFDLKILLIINVFIAFVSIITWNITHATCTLAKSGQNIIKKINGMKSIYIHSSSYDNKTFWNRQTPATI
jgi:hypothetical protein